MHRTSPRRPYKRAFEWLKVTFHIWLVCIATTPGYANPLGGSVVAGSANISSAGNTLTVDQSSSRAVINWQSFSIGRGEVTRFNQPSSSAAVLNRVIAANPSQLMGSLQSNGQVFLINPSGILVGPNASINVGALTASTLDIANDEFMRGGSLTFRGASDASAVNYGAISAASGDIYIIGATVENHGTLTAANGTVGLGAGRVVTLVDSASPALKVNVKTGAGSVVNTGSIEALRAELAANGGNVYALAINNKGTVRVNSAVAKAGRIYLTTGNGKIVNDGKLIAGPGRVEINAGEGVASGSGTIDASGEQGGQVSVAADQIELAGATIDASGTSGGGRVFIGGGAQGATINGNPNASRVTIDAGTNVTADATIIGTGGTVVVWSDNHTDFAGSITALGGGGAAGGSVEVSSGELLSFRGNVTTGAGGTFLLDPGTYNVGEVPGDFSGRFGTETISAADFAASWENNGTFTVTAAAVGGDGNNDGLEPSINFWDEVIVDTSNSLQLFGEGDVNVVRSVVNRGDGSITVTVDGDFNVDSTRSSRQGNVTFGSIGGPVEVTAANVNVNSSADQHAVLGSQTGGVIVNAGRRSEELGEPIRDNVRFVEAGGGQVVVSSNGAPAVIGYYGNAREDGPFLVNNSVSVTASQVDVRARNEGLAQIGNVVDATAKGSALNGVVNVLGDVTVDVSGDVTVHGESYAHSRIGNLSYADVSVQATGEYAFADVNADVTVGGNTRIDAGGEIVVRGLRGGAAAAGNAAYTDIGATSRSGGELEQDSDHTRRKRLPGAQTNVNLATRVSGDVELNADRIAVRGVSGSGRIGNFAATSVLANAIGDEVDKGFGGRASLTVGVDSSVTGNVAANAEHIAVTGVLVGDVRQQDRGFANARVGNSQEISVTAHQSSVPSPYDTSFVAQESAFPADGVSIKAATTGDVSLGGGSLIVFAGPDPRGVAGIDSLDGLLSGNGEFGTPAGEAYAGVGNGSMIDAHQNGPGVTRVMSDVQGGVDVQMERSASVIALTVNGSTDSRQQSVGGMFMDAASRVGHTNLVDVYTTAQRSQAAAAAAKTSFGPFGSFPTVGDVSVNASTSGQTQISAPDAHVLSLALGLGLDTLELPRVGIPAAAAAQDSQYTVEGAPTGAAQVAIGHINSIDVEQSGVSSAAPSMSKYVKATTFNETPPQDDIPTARSAAVSVSSTITGDVLVSVERLFGAAIAANVRVPAVPNIETPSESKAFAFANKYSTGTSLLSQATTRIGHDQEISAVSNAPFILIASETGTQAHPLGPVGTIEALANTTGNIEVAATEGITLLSLGLGIGIEGDIVPVFPDDRESEFPNDRESAATAWSSPTGDWTLETDAALGIGHGTLLRTEQVGTPGLTRQSDSDLYKFASLPQVPWDTTITSSIDGNVNVTSGDILALSIAGNASLPIQFNVPVPEFPEEFNSVAVATSFISQDYGVPSDLLADNAQLRLGHLQSISSVASSSPLPGNNDRGVVEGPPPVSTESVGSVAINAATTGNVDVLSDFNTTMLSLSLGLGLGGAADSEANASLAVGHDTWIDAHQLGIADQPLLEAMQYAYETVATTQPLVAGTGTDIRSATSGSVSVNASDLTALSIAGNLSVPLEIEVGGNREVGLASLLDAISFGSGSSGSLNSSASLEIGHSQWIGGYAASAPFGSVVASKEGPSSLGPAGLVTVDAGTTGDILLSGESVTLLSLGLGVAVNGAPVGNDDSPVEELLSSDVAWDGPQDDYAPGSYAALSVGHANAIDVGSLGTAPPPLQLGGNQGLTAARVDSLSVVGPTGPPSAIEVRSLVEGNLSISGTSSVTVLSIAGNASIDVPVFDGNGPSGNAWLVAESELAIGHDQSITANAATASPFGAALNARSNQDQENGRPPLDPVGLIRIAPSTSGDIELSAESVTLLSLALGLGVEYGGVATNARESTASSYGYGGGMEGTAGLFVGHDTSIDVSQLGLRPRLPRPQHGKPGDDKPGDTDELNDSDVLLAVVGDPAPVGPLGGVQIDSSIMGDITVDAVSLNALSVSGNVSLPLELLGGIFGEELPPSDVYGGSSLNSHSSLGIGHAQSIRASSSSVFGGYAVGASSETQPVGPFVGPVGDVSVRVSTAGDISFTAKDASFLALTLGADVGVLFGAGPSGSSLTGSSELHVGHSHRVSALQEGLSASRPPRQMHASVKERSEDERSSTLASIGAYGQGHAPDPSGITVRSSIAGNITGDFASWQIGSNVFDMSLGGPLLANGGDYGYGASAAARTHVGHSQSLRVSSLSPPSVMFASADQESVERNKTEPAPHRGLFADIRSRTVGDITIAGVDTGALFAQTGILGVGDLILPPIDVLPPDVIVNPPGDVAPLGRPVGNIGPSLPGLGELGGNGIDSLLQGGLLGVAPGDFGLLGAIGNSLPSSGGAAETQIGHRANTAVRHDGPGGAITGRPGTISRHPSFSEPNSDVAVSGQRNAGPIADVTVGSIVDGNVSISAEGQLVVASRATSTVPFFEVGAATSSLPNDFVPMSGATAELQLGHVQGLGVSVGGSDKQQRVTNDSGYGISPADFAARARTVGDISLASSVGTVVSHGGLLPDGLARFVSGGPFGPVALNRDGPGLGDLFPPLQPTGGQVRLHTGHSHTIGISQNAAAGGVAVESLSKDVDFGFAPPRLNVASEIDGSIAGRFESLRIESIAAGGLPLFGARASSQDGGGPGSLADLQLGHSQQVYVDTVAQGAGRRVPVAPSVDESVERQVDERAFAWIPDVRIRTSGDVELTAVTTNMLTQSGTRQFYGNLLRGDRAPAANVTNPLSGGSASTQLGHSHKVYVTKYGSGASVNHGQYGVPPLLAQSEIEGGVTLNADVLNLITVARQPAQRWSDSLDNDYGGNQAPADTRLGHTQMIDATVHNLGTKDGKLGASNRDGGASLIVDVLTAGRVRLNLDSGSMISLAQGGEQLGGESATARSTSGHSHDIEVRGDQTRLRSAIGGNVRALTNAGWSTLASGPRAETQMGHTSNIYSSSKSQGGWQGEPQTIVSGLVEATAENGSLSFVADGYYATAQLGHQGYNTEAYLGNVTTAASDHILLFAGDMAHVDYGHHGAYGGNFANPVTYAGDLTATADALRPPLEGDAPFDPGVSLLADDGGSVQFGHYGQGRSRVQGIGDILISTDGDFFAQATNSSNVHVGFGGSEGAEYRGNIGILAGLDVSLITDVTIDAGPEGEARAFQEYGPSNVRIGHGDVGTHDNVTGQILMTYNYLSLPRDTESTFTATAGTEINAGRAPVVEESRVAVAELEIPRGDLNKLQIFGVIQRIDIQGDGSPASAMFNGVPYNANLAPPTGVLNDQGWIQRTPLTSSWEHEVLGFVLDDALTATYNAPFTWYYLPAATAGEDVVVNVGYDNVFTNYASTVFDMLPPAATPSTIGGIDWQNTDEDGNDITSGNSSDVYVAP